MVIAIGTKLSPWILLDRAIGPLYEAMIEATEEAILNEV
jgi:hypothetical protein